MKQVIEHYGQFILECMVVVVVLTIVFITLTDREGNKGIYAIAGAQIDFYDTDYRNYMDFRGTYKTESENTAPQIIFESGRLVVGIHTLSNYIKAVDYAGTPLAVNVLSIKAPNGMEMIGTYNHTTTEFNMSQPGVYTMSLFVLDDRNKSTKATIQIPVGKETI